MSLLHTLSKVLQNACRIDDPPRDPYPRTVEECINDKLVYSEKTKAAVEHFRDLQPYRGTAGERQVKFRMLNTNLAAAYGISEPRLVFVDSFPAGPCCFPTSRPAVIMMEPVSDGSYSIVSFLHEFAHALGKNERGACVWSLNLFKRYWPKSFDRLEPKGHLLYKKQQPEAVQ